MSAQWVNKYAIMRDLSMVQGCVPVDLAGTITANDRPPSRNVVEETEEEYYLSFIGGTGDFAAPDIGLIKHMLQEVRNEDVPDKIEEDIDIIQISKLNPFCPEFKPLLTTEVSTEVKKCVKKKSRNAAVQSILQNIDNNMKITLNEDVIPKDIETVVNSKSPDKTKKKTKSLHLNDPSSMFKKKKSDCEAPKPVEQVKATSPYNYAKYKPSNNVHEYYRRFVESSKMKQIVQEDVWSKVERQMKEIDQRRAAEAELFALSLALDETPTPPHEAASPDCTKQILEMVFLPHHRHSLPESCRVCELRDALNKPREFNNNNNNSQQPDINNDSDNNFIDCEDVVKCNKIHDNNAKSYNKHEARGEKVDENNKTIDANDDNIDNNNKMLNTHDVEYSDSSNTLDSNRKPLQKENYTAVENSESFNEFDTSVNTIETQIQESYSLYDEDDDIDAWRFENLGYEDNEFYDCEISDASELFIDTESTQLINFNEDVATEPINFEKRRIRTVEDNLDALAANESTKCRTFEFEITKPETVEFNKLNNIRLQKLLKNQALMMEKLHLSDGGDDDDDDDEKPFKTDSFSFTSDLI